MFGRAIIAAGSWLALKSYMWESVCFDGSLYKNLCGSLGAKPPMESWGKAPLTLTENHKITQAFHVPRGILIHLASLLNSCRIK
jgi:hypothetical protein